MGLVVAAGLTKDNCFGWDLFPQRVHHWYLENFDPRDQFMAFRGKFDYLFLRKNLHCILDGGGLILLVFGRIAIQIIIDELNLNQIELPGNEHLEIFWERVFAIMSFQTQL